MSNETINQNYHCNAAEGDPINLKHEYECSGEVNVPGSKRLMKSPVLCFPIPVFDTTHHYGLNTQINVKKFCDLSFGSSPELDSKT